ncbi:MAG: ArnT family glycosyltransferase [Candidatus Kariarchaeaceae archaeon]
MLFLIAFFLRVIVIGKSGLHQDEIEKAIAVEHYKNFDFSYDPEHPALMKLMITISIFIFGDGEFAIRFPNVLVGALTVYPIFFLGRALHSDLSGIIASTLWAVNITTISFATIAKEDAFLTFFGTSAIYFYLKSRNNPKYLNRMGISIGLALASKYTALMFIFLILIIHHYVYRKNLSIHSIKIMLQKVGVPAFSIFLIFNFPIINPSTLIELLDYVNQPQLHTGHLIMGNLVKARPFYFLFLHILVKYPLSTLIVLIVSVYIAAKQRNDTNKLLLIWAVIPVVFYSVTPFYGRNTRYYHVAEPAFMLLIAIGIIKISIFISENMKNIKIESNLRGSNIITIIIVSIVAMNSVSALFSSYPYYRLSVNELGGGDDRAGYYFPQDSVFDYYLREAVFYVNENAPQNSFIAIPIVEVGIYYGRSDLTFVDIGHISADINEWKQQNISYAIVQSSRTYYENVDVFEDLRNTLSPEKTFIILENTVVELYLIN